MRTTLLAIAAALNGALPAQWALVPSGTLTQLEDVHPVDASTAIPRCNDGVLLRSTDGGNSWAPLPSGFGDDINHIMQLGPQEFILFADGGAAIRSTDGGNTWMPGVTTTASELVGAGRADALIVAVGENGAIVRSASGGVTWNTEVSGTVNDLQAVCPQDEMTWIAVGKSGTCLKSVNGGSDWVPVVLAVSADLNDICFLSEQVGLICGDEGVILRTIDGGVSWTNVISGTGNELNALWATSASEVYTCGAGGTVLKSIDGGLSWSAMVSSTASVLRDIVVGNGNGFAVGELGTIFRLGLGAIGLTEAAFVSGVRLSPVPAVADVQLTMADPRFLNQFVAEVIDARGTVVRRTGVIGSTARFTGLSSGSYVLRLVHEGMPLYSRSFVVAR